MANFTNSDGALLAVGLTSALALAGRYSGSANAAPTDPVSAVKRAIDIVERRIWGRGAVHLDEAVVSPSANPVAARIAPGAEVVVFREHGYPDDMVWWTQVDAELAVMGVPLYHESINPAVYAFYRTDGGTGSLSIPSEERVYGALMEIIECHEDDVGRGIPFSSLLWRTRRALMRHGIHMNRISTLAALRALQRAGLIYEDSTGWRLG